MPHTNNPDTFQPPELNGDTVRGCTYSATSHALALVTGLNVPFMSKLARNVRDSEGYHLWSSPRIVAILAKANHAFQSNDEAEEQRCIRQAIDLVNVYLPDAPLPDWAILRLTWAPLGIASVTCERNRRLGNDMDVVRCGAATSILCAPYSPKSGDLVINVHDPEMVFVGTTRQR